MRKKLGFMAIIAISSLLCTTSVNAAKPESCNTEALDIGKNVKFAFEAPAVMDSYEVTVITPSVAIEVLPIGFNHPYLDNTQEIAPVVTRTNPRLVLEQCNSPGVS